MGPVALAMRFTSARAGGRGAVPDKLGPPPPNGARLPLHPGTPRHRSAVVRGPGQLTDTRHITPSAGGPDIAYIGSACGPPRPAPARRLAPRPPILPRLQPDPEGSRRRPPAVRGRACRTCGMAARTSLPKVCSDPTSRPLAWFHPARRHTGRGSRPRGVGPTRQHSRTNARTGLDRSASSRWYSAAASFGVNRIPPSRSRTHPRPPTAGCRAVRPPAALQIRGPPSRASCSGVCRMWNREAIAPDASGSRGISFVAIRNRTRSRAVIRGRFFRLTRLRVLAADRQQPLDHRPDVRPAATAGRPG